MHIQNIYKNICKHNTSEKARNMSCLTLRKSPQQPAKQDIARHPRPVFVGFLRQNGDV